MYGQRNYAPQLASTPHRPIPLPQQQHGGFAQPPFRQPPPLQSLPLVQQPALPHAVQSGPTAQLHALSIPPSIPRHGRSGLMPNPGQYHLHQNPMAHGSRPMLDAYPSSLQTAMCPSHAGTQNVPWAPSPARPLLSLFGPSRAPPPPPSQPQQMFRHPAFPTPPPPPPQFTRLPPVPPTGSGLFRPVGGVWASPSMTEKSSTQPLPSSPPPPPPSSPPPPSPPPPPPSPPPPSSFSPSGAISLAPSNAAAHEALLPDASINSCQATQSDGFDTTDVMLQADDSRDNKGLSIKGSWVHDKSASQNSPSDLLPSPPKSCGEKNSGNMSSIKHEEENYPSVDSDIDMEDDITQFDKDQMGFYSGNKLEIVMQDAVQSSGDDHVEGKRAPTVDSKDDSVTKSEESPDPVLRASPFRLIQSYASDDSLDEDNNVAPHREFNPTTASETYKEGAPTSHGDVVHGRPKSEFPEINLEKFESSKDCRSTAPQNEADELAGVNAKAEALSDTSSGSFQQINTLSKASFDVVYDGVKVPKEDVRKATVKVDEFGRLVREDICESESADSDKSRRRSRRHRSRSRSESPPHRRRRRTPLRREMRRSRSGSWSPRKRRMRSRSPSRHGTVVEADWQRRDGAKIGECFNFLKGRCYRGASCRYLHQDLDQHDGSGRSRSRQQYSEVPRRSRNSNSDKEDEDIKVRPPLEEDEVEAHDHLAHDDMLSHELSASQNTNVREERKTDLEMNEIPHSGVSQGDTANIYCVEKTENLEANSGLFSQPLIQEAPCDVSPPVEDVKHRKTSVASVEDEAVQHASADLSVPEHNLVDRMDSSAASFSAVSKTSAASSSQLPVGEPYLCKITNEVGSQENPVSSGCASMDLKHHAPQLPFPPPQQTSHGVDASQSLHTLGAHNSVSVVVSPLQPSPVKRDPHQSHASNQRLYPVPVNQMWSARLPYIVDPTTSSVPLHFQQGHLSVRNEIVKHTSTELPGHLEVTGSQHHAYSSLQDPLRPPLHVAELHNKPLQPIGAPNQQLGGTSLLWDDRYGHMPSRDTVSSSLFPPGSSTLQPSKLHEELSSRTLQPFASRDHLLYQHQPSLGLQQTTLDKLSSYLGGSSTSSSVPADPVYRNHQSILSDLGGSRIIAHYNPYASTFEKPLNLKFSFKTERDSYIYKHDVPFAPVPLSVEGQRMSNLELEHIVSSPNAYPSTGQALRKSGDQYDPFEPGSESSKKHALNYDSMFKLSGSHEPLATQENKRVKEDGDIAASLFIENDEFGETADAEAGAVENGSTSHPNDEANASAGENEIDQVRSKGKNKKNKDSRGMKLFQAELANFVKEVLKPSWRQGNMSKEAFKTIVKKTVEKVSSAMKNHRVPKSKENISRYIDSSHRKLTRLVEGYVSKYAKA